MATITKKTNTSSEQKLSFKYLPQYAAFIRDQHLLEYVTTLLDLSRANKVPLLRFFEGYSEEQIIELSRQSSSEFLTWLADDDASGQISDAVRQWKENKLPILGQYDITLEDITLVSYVRRKTLTSLLPLYTTDFMQAVMVLNDMDDYFKESDSVYSETYIALLRQRLHTREEQLLEAQSIAGVGSFIWNLETEVGDVSPVVLELLDLRNGNHLQDFLNKIHPLDRDRFMAVLNEAKQDGRPLDIEYRYQSQGKERLMWSRGTVSHENGVPFIKGTVMDVTERHSLLRKLQDNERLYKQAQERAHIGNFVWNLKTNKIFWSDELYRIYGLDPARDKINYKQYMDMLRVEDRNVLLENIERTMRTGAALDFDFRIVQPSGEEKILNIKAELEKDEYGVANRFVGTIQDITDKQMLIERLQESELLYKQAQASTHIGNWKWDLLTNEVSWSEEMYRIYGLEEGADLSYENYIKRIHPDHVEERRHQVQRALETGEPQEYIYRIIRPDGQERILHTRLEVVRGDSGKAVQLVGTCQDVTEMQLLIERLQKGEEELQKKNLELELSNANLQEFAYVASHDLKEPLRKISTFGEMLFQFTTDNLSDKGKFYVEKMVEGSRRMQHMIDELLSFAVISRNKAFEKTNLNEVLKKVLADLEIKIQEKEAVIESTELPEVNVVPGQFEQLFQNLLSNSLKFSRPGVPPHIRITHRELSRREVDERGLFPRSRYLLLSLEDNGIGFEQEYAQKIFGMFQRLHGKVDYDGSGIGLSICKKIVENHGGQIEAFGSPGEGSRFHILLPLS